jgi:hypothetical protein
LTAVTIDFRILIGKNKIDKIYVDTSLAYEKIDRFFNSYSWESLTTENVWTVYKNHLRKDSGESIWDIYGIYKTAQFMYDGSFQPKWGLNVNSFLKEGTPEYDKTFELWSREIEINQKKELLRNELNILEAEMKKVDEEYRDIKHC